MGRHAKDTTGGSSSYSGDFGDEDILMGTYSESTQRKLGSQKTSVPTRPVLIEKSSEQWQKATAWAPEDRPDWALRPNGDSFIDALEAGILDDLPHSDISGIEPIQNKTGEGKGKRKERSKVSKRPHVVWRDIYRQTYLDELCRRYGRGDYRKTEKCPDCIARKEEHCGDAIYRCSSGCFIEDLKWTGTCFIKVSLKSLGLRMQLNHTGKCTNHIPCHSSLSVLHVNGIHEVAFDYCGCEYATPKHIQHLRRGYYPSSQRVIKICATFELLELIHKLSLTTKAAVYDFYRAIEKTTDSTGLRTPKVKYRALLRMSIQFRHLKILMWAGRGHDPTGAAGTLPGALAIRCPSCAHPGINLPENWNVAPKEKQYLYRLFACMDANFRLKNRLVSNYSQDPGLGIGMAYVVPRQGYEEYVLQNASEGDISSCVGFQAIAQANTRFSKGLRYTGVGGVFCGRSEMILPNGIGNLQKGERYCNMDYIFASAIRDYLNLLFILISYDIACQWFINLSNRITSTRWPEGLQFPAHLTLIPAIPKMHEPMHDGPNHQQYSLNLIPGVGFSDLECPERVWAGHNFLGHSTLTQGPGSRQDVLDDHFGWWNWLKYIGMGSTLKRRYWAAVADRNLQVEAHKFLTSSLDKKLVDRWTDICEKWEAASFPKKVKNPYELEGTQLGEAEVRKALAKEEELRLAKGGKSLHQTGPDNFIATGLQIEATQRRLKRLAKDKVAQATARQESGLIEQRNHLRMRLNAWELLLPIYMPGILQYRTELDRKSKNVSPEPEHPEEKIIWLPSLIPTKNRDQVCHESLASIEHRLRVGQCHDGLDGLRQTLKVKARMIQFKNKNIRGQRQGTRSLAIIDRVRDRANGHAQKYRRARLAITELVGEGDWERVLKVLEDGDVRMMHEGLQRKAKAGPRGTLEDTQLADGDDGASDLMIGSETEQSSGKRPGTGETRRQISWIWLMKQGDQTENDSDLVLQAEWCKSRARSKRATEEVELLKEEMRRTLEYLGYKKRWWLEQIGRRDVHGSLKEGLIAIANKQAKLQQELAEKFRASWQEPLGNFELSKVADALEEDEKMEEELPDGKDEDDIDEEEEEAEEVREDDDEKTLDEN